MLLKMAQAEANNCSIDKSKFERTINLKALRIPTQRCSTLMKRLRQFTLKRSKVRQVVVPLENNNDTRLILLDEQISQKDSMQDDGLLELLDGESFEVCGYELKLGYEHLNVKEVLEQVLPAGVEVPVAFETVGHIAHLNLTPQQMPFKHQIGQTLLDKNPTISTVVTKVGSIENEFRVFDMEVIAGENRLETEVVQYGTKFKLDFQKVYWNSRLEQEHKRVVGLLRSSEVIVDMMAGIGPFAIPAARKGCKVYANDLNPDSYRYLEINKKLNKIQEDRLQLFNMDAKTYFLCESFQNSFLNKQEVLRSLLERVKAMQAQSEIGEDLVQQFVQITGCEREQARFYLEAAGGNIQAALSVFQEQQLEHNEGGGHSNQAPGSSLFAAFQQQSSQHRQPVPPQQRQQVNSSSRSQHGNAVHVLNEVLRVPGRFLTFVFGFIGQTMNFGFSVLLNIGRRVLPAPVIRRIRRSVEEIGLQLGNHSSQEQARSFIQEFEARYSNCAERPNFQEDGPREAARIAHQQFRLLFVYLHSAEHEDTDRFVTNSLCSNTVASFINRTMLCWGGSIHHSDGFRLAGALGAATYPFCAVLAFSGSRLTLVTQIQGLVSADVLLESLGQGVDNFEPRLVAERAEQQEREFSRKLRDEQDEAYQESLRMDREKEEKANQIRQEQQEQLKKQQQEEETKRLELERQQLKEQEFQNRIQMRKQQKGASLPEEPAVGTPSTTLIRIRLPDGSNQQRRFNDQDKVSVVYDFVCSLEALKCWKFSLASSYPRKVYGPETHSLNLQDAGLSPQAVLFVQPEDEEK
eukprot:TRINITY_DN2835_c0_g1_i2.p1 TRINITY_DN2835_c0_g1~~TRINITY_DN2835_c0_g1_i2.p1  ORF type:complete len:804 (-),score=139.45 TRINITY_DN2835_c0_g1_i2:256-2667(-)